MQAQAAGTSTNGTVDGSPPRYLAINALIDAVVDQTLDDRIEDRLLAVALAEDRAVLLAGLELGDDLLLAARLGGLAEVDRRVDQDPVDLCRRSARRTPRTRSGNDLTLSSFQPGTSPEVM